MPHTLLAMLAYYNILVIMTRLAECFGIISVMAPYPQPSWLRTHNPHGSIPTTLMAPCPQPSWLHAHSLDAYGPSAHVRLAYVPQTYNLCRLPPIHQWPTPHVGDVSQAYHPWRIKYWPKPNYPSRTNVPSQPHRPGVFYDGCIIIFNKEGDW